MGINTKNTPDTEEFYSLALKLTYTEPGLNQSWADSLLNEICESDIVSVEKTNSEPLEMRLAKRDLGICARTNSPNLVLYAYGNSTEIAKIIEKLSRAFVVAAKKVRIPVPSANDLKRYFSFSKETIGTDDPLISGLWKVDNERKKSLKYFKI